IVGYGDIPPGYGSGRLVSGGIRCVSDHFIVGYGTVAFFYGGRIFKVLFGSGTGDFRWEYCFHIPYRFAAGSGGILARKRREDAGKGHGSGRIPRDPVTSVDSAYDIVGSWRFHYIP
ncbi:unnamed protein product, partial [Adineta ricciae]